MHSPNTIIMESNSPPPALPPKQRPRTGSVKPSPPPTPTINEVKPQSPVKTLPDLLEHTTNSVTKTAEDKNEISEVNRCDIDLMEEVDDDKALVLKKPEEEGPEIRGGPIDALIIQATKATKNGGKYQLTNQVLHAFSSFICMFMLIMIFLLQFAEEKENGT